jgi:mannose-6-phosphate isomerase-like protein (cupin superfamily)
MSEKRYEIYECGAFDKLSRVMLKEKLNSSGMEISVNHLPAGQAIPFVHAHKQNEEVYLFLSGKGLFWIDGEQLEVGEGSAIRVAPAGGRAIKADEGTGLSYICIQAKAQSLQQSTREDGVILETQASW